MTSSQKPAQDARLKVLNASRGTLLADSLEVADTSRKRNKGLLGRSHLGHGEGLWIVPCESVHTFFMRFPIDLVYLDRKHRIKKLCRNVRPWRLSFCLSAHSIIELPAGVIHESHTECGDRIEFTAVDPASESSSNDGRQS